MTQRALGVGALAIALVALAVYIGIRGLGSYETPIAGATATAGPAGSNSTRITVREVHRFDSIASLVATADAVAVLRIQSVTDDSHDDPDGGRITTLDVSADVMEVLSGALPARSIHLVFDGAYREPGVRGTDDDWTEGGRSVLIALHLRTDNGAYRPLNMQSVFTIDSDGTVSPVWKDDLTLTLEGRTLANVQADIEEANRSVELGLFTPQPERPVADVDN